MADTHEEPASQEAVRLVAGLCIQAALTFELGDEQPHLPSRGWMPPPATGSPEVEYGAAMAVSALVYAFDLDREQVARVATQLIDS